MGKQRKIRCDCGGEYRPKIVVFEGISVEAMVCSLCNDETFTLSQSKKLLEMAQIKKAVEKQRKVIKVGDSLAITLPKSFEEYGWTVGKPVHLTSLGKKSLKIDVS